MATAPFPRYLEAERMWLLSAPESIRCEVLVSGDPTSPDTVRLAFVQGAIASLDDLQVKAISYLEDFIDLQKLGSNGKWSLEGIESGRLQEKEDQLSLGLTFDADLYGYWLITFQLS